MSYRRSGVSVLAGVGLVVALGTGSVRVATAQEASTNPAPLEFAGHHFIPSTVVPDPFISTTLTTMTGFGSAVNLEVPIYNLRGTQIAEASADVGYMLLGFDYSLALNPRWSLRASGNGSARIGTSPVSVLAEGISALYGYGFGTSLNVWRKQSWQLAATADLRGNTLYAVSPLTFLRAVVDAAVAGDTTGVTGAQDSLLASGDNWRALGGIRAAYTPAPWIGFTGFIETGVGQKFQSGTSNTGVTNLGATASIDFNSQYKVPFGLMGAFRYESLNEKSDEIASAQVYDLGLFYTGRPFFSVGLENTWNRIGQARTTEKIEAVQSRIVVRYDFK